MAMMERIVWIALLAAAIGGLAVFWLLYADLDRSLTYRIWGKSTVALQTLERMDTAQHDDARLLVETQAKAGLTRIYLNEEKFEKYLTDDFHEMARAKLPEFMERFTNEITNQQTFSASEPASSKARERRHSGTVSSERNAAGGRL